MKTKFGSKVMQINSKFDENNIAFSNEYIRLPRHINYFLSGEGKTETIKRPNPETLSNLKYKIFNAYEDGCNLLKIMGRDTKNIPFVVYSVSDDRVLDYIFEAITDKNINSIKKKRILKSEIFVYLSNFSDNRQTRLLGEDITRRFNEDNIYNKRLLQWKENIFLFSKDTLEYVNNAIKDKDFLEYFREIGFPESLMNSNYVKAVFEHAFTKGVLTNKMKLFTKIYGSESDRNKRDIFREKLPDILSILIKNVDDSDSIEREDYIEEIRSTAYEMLGDPRLKSKRVFQQWDRVDKEAKAIFIRWVSQCDLELFFKIIALKAVDRMWKYREVFWKNYIPYMRKTWVAFGWEAEQIAKQISKDNLLSYGELSAGATASQSVFIFEIADLVFIEWSHNGSLRVWERNSCPFNIGDAYISGNRIRHSGLDIAVWPHYRAEKFEWQAEVAQFILNKTGIKSNPKNWRP